MVEAGLSSIPGTPGFVPISREASPSQVVEIGAGLQRSGVSSPIGTPGTVLRPRGGRRTSTGKGRRSLSREQQQAQREAQQREAEQKIIAAERQRQSQEREAARQEKIQAGRIVGQLGGVPTGGGQLEDVMEDIRTFRAGARPTGEILRDISRAQRVTLEEFGGGLSGAIRTGVGRAEELIEDVLFGETGKKLVGVGVFTGLGAPGATGTGAFITAEEIKGGLREGGLGVAGQVIEPLIPETPGEIALVAGGLQVIKALPPAGRIALDVIFTPGEIKTALDPQADLATRIRSGAFATLGVGGTILEGAPFIKGAVSRFAPGFRGITVDEAVDVGRLFPKGRADIIKGVSTGDDVIDLRLIERGKGFDFPISEQEQFIGSRGTITTAARDLLGKVDDIIVESREPGDLGLFFTPTPGTGVGDVRVSRLGLKDFFKPTGFGAEIGFGGEQPQIVFLQDVPITKRGAAGTARGVGFPSTELEVTLLPGTEITGRQVGATTIKGQKVEIFEGFIGAGDDVLAPPKVDITGLDLSRGAPTTTVDPFSVAFSGKTAIDLLDVSTKDLSDISAPTRRTARPTSPLDFTQPIFDIVPSRPTRRKGRPSRPTRAPSRAPVIDTSFFVPPSRPPARPPARPTTTPSPTRLPRIEDIFGQDRRRRRRPDGRGKKKKFKRVKRTRFTERIAPSLTGITQFDLGDITGDPLKLSGALGRSPARLRLVPESLVGAGRQDFSAFLGSSPRRKSTGKKKK